MKRVLSLLLCAVLLFSMIPVIDTNAENDTDTTQTVENDFSVSGTNSVGNLLSDGIQQTQEETEPVAVPETESVAAVRKPAVKSAASLADDTYASADGKWSFVPYGEGVEITAYHGNAADVYVPFKVTYNEEDYAVLKLADSLFADNDSLNSVTLGEGILEIGAKTFYDCDNLVCIVTNETMTTISAEAFYSCDSFNSVILYDAVAIIGENAFAECPSLTIWCNESTAAHTYATANSIPYEILNPNATPETYIQDGITYYIMNGAAIAIDFDESTTEVVVPSLIEGYPVTELRETFRDCSSIVSVTLQDTLQKIGNYAFSSCSSLTSVNVPDSVLTIGYYAFFYCESLTGINIPNSVTSIGNYAFKNCRRLADIIIPNSVTFIGDYSFQYCRSLNSVTIPDSVTSIGVHTFYDCTSLTSVSIGNGVTNIGNLAFYDCTSLTSVSIGSSVTNIGNQAFYGCSSLQTLLIPHSVTSIGNRAFSSCSSLTSVSIGNSVTSIGSYAFEHCTSLRAVILPESVSTMYANSFPGSTVLLVYENSYAHTFAESNELLYVIYNGINEPEIIEQDGVRYCIVNCKAIAIDFDESTTEVVIPAAVDGFPVTELLETFRDCGSITSVTLPDTLQKIGNYVFYQCTSLTNVNIPDSVNSIGTDAFYRCVSLTSITIPDSVTQIGHSAFSYCGLTSVSIGNSVTNIGNQAFYYCTSLTSVSIGSSVIDIGYQAFYNCSSLQTVLFPDGVTNIGNQAFYNCASLTSINIPDGVTQIGDAAFSDCNSLQTVILPESVSTMYANSFPDSTVLLVYENSYAHTFAEDNELLYVIYNGINEPEIIEQDGVLYCIVNCKAIAIDFDESTTEVVIPAAVEGFPVTELLETFRDCGSITSVTLPDTLQKIGNYVFYQCTSLTNVNIPDSVNSIGDKAFSYCSSLTSINIPDSVNSIGGSAFSHCYSLTSIMIPDSVTNIGAGAFQSCESLTSVNIPDSVTSIGHYAFSYCDSLTSITLPDSLTRIRYYTFYSCDSLTSITIPDSVTRIEQNAFCSCDHLTSITIGDGVKTIENNAFSGCSSLQTVIVPESVSAMYINSFPASTILLVYENSYAHTIAANNDLLYFVIRKTENPEISFGTGISGNVSYLDGSVAANATVEIFYDDGVLKKSVVTDETGAYEFTYAEVGAYTIRVTDANGNTASTAVSVKRMNAFDVYLSGDTDLKLKKGYSVSGTVNTYPATITITDEDGNVLGSVETADGSFSFSNISNGTYIITATTESGSVSQEITVFDGDVSDIVLTVATTSATLWGYVEVEDRELGHHRRNWVEVTVYNAEGIVVGQCKTDMDGKYTFAGLPVGEYAIVAETAEMRPDHKHGFDRSHTLTGYAYMDVTEAGTYQVETIVLREENDNKATISGKVTAHGETQNCQVVLYNVFRSEIASMTTGKNGKYSFKNVSDGLYFITATTESNGMGYAVVVVRNGKVYGETDITVFKSDKVKDREDKFHNDIPECHSREDALKHRDRIAEEKRFYDGLSEKEKKQVSKDYVNRLDQLVQWITDCTVETGDGVTLEQGGLVISGDEAQNAEQITFTLNVTPSQAHDASTDGVYNREDQIHHNIHDKSDKHDVLQYYDITLSKEVDGVSTDITSVTKDTEANGKLRVTMEIPKEYRGYKHYTVIHEHCGEVVTLTDLDDDPNTVTFEVKKFSTFVLAGTNITLTEIVDEESAIVESWGLTLEDDIRVNFTMTLSEEILADSGAYVEIAVADTVTNIPVADAANGVQAVLAAAQMTDTITLCIVDGSGNRSESSSYTVRQYCDIILADESYSKYHTLAKEMLNYGAMAQVYFDYDADNLANDGITGAAAEAVPENWEKQTVSGKLSGLKFYGASLSFRDKIAVRYYFTGDVTGCSFRDASGNTYTPVAKDNMYYVEIADILPQDLDQQIALTVTDSSGNSLAVSYSPMNYIVRMNEKGSDAMKALLRALYNYHLAAKAFQTETV